LLELRSFDVYRNTVAPMIVMLLGVRYRDLRCRYGNHGIQ